MSTGLTRSRLARALAATVAVLVVASGLTLTAPVPAEAATGSVSGTVFRDYNANGRFDTTATPNSGNAVDTGIGGVTVTAYDSANAVFGTTTTSAASAALGQWTISGNTGALPGRLRVEFTALPAGFVASPMFDATAGARNGSNVQFVALGATNVNFGANVPETYAQSNAPLVTAIQYSGQPIYTPAAGDPASADARNSPAVVAAPYALNQPVNGSTSTGANAFNGRTTLATFGQVGAVWGTAYRPSNNDLFVSATYKRHAGLGTLGIGGIYRITNVLNSDGTVNPTPTVTAWKDIVATLGVPLGTVQSNTARGLKGAGDAAFDTDGFAKSGIVGIGGMTVSADGKTLYLINLAAKTLVAIDITSTTTPVLLSTTPLGLGTGERPWALGLHDNQLYVGYVTTGETAGGFNPGRSAAAAGMTASVKRTALPVSASSTFTTVLNAASLGYAKGDIYSNVLQPQSQRWNTWTDTWAWSVNGGGRVSEADGGWHMYPQPILSSLYFDESNYMTLGFSDRTSIQGGNRNFSSETGTTAHYETGASGDILIASTTNGSSWTLESNGTVGNRTAATLNAAQGPGGFEFYNDRMNVGAGNTHQEVALGSLAGIRGTREVVSTAYDPLAGIRLAGNSWYSTSTGTNLAGYEHTADPGGSTTSTASGTFQKGGGLGAVQLLAEAAPIEVGNRVWFDADQDGVQDADEPTIAGATVELRQGGTLIKSTTTAADGSYYFSSDPDSAYFAGAAFVPNGGDYTITFVKPAGNLALSGPNATSFGTIAWNSAALTITTGGTALSGSDPDPSSGVVTFAAGPAGSVNHDIDAGYRANSSFTVAKALAGAGVPIAGQTFTMTATATDFRGASLPLGAAGTITLAAGATSSPVSVPTGSSVTVSESGTGAYKAVSITPSTATVVTGSTPVAFTVTNTLYEAGRFRVSKSVTGAAGGSVPSTQSYTVNYSHPGGSGTLTVTKGGTSAFSSPIPHGAVVTLSEVAPTGAAADVVYGTALWSGTGVTDNGDGTASFTMTEGASLEVALTNPTTQLTGGFSVTKSVTGTGNVSVPAGYSFVVQYSLDGGTTWVDRTVSKNAPTFTVAGVPTGRSVLVREVAPTADIADVAWGTPVYSGAGVSVAAGVASLTIGDGTTVAVGLENPTTRLTGSFSITKTVGADATASVPGNTPFTLQYSVDGGTTWVTTTVTKDSPTFTSLPIPTGTTVLITEDAPGNIAGVSWGDPIFSGAGVTVTADGASLVIGNATTVAVGLLNPTTQLVQFSITKNVTGPAEATLTPGHLFTGTWTYPGKATPGTFSIANGGVFTSPGIPRGTVVTITETDPTGGLPVGSSWGIPNLVVGTTDYDNGDPITMSALGVTAIDLVNPTLVTPDVSIVKGDALGNAADTMADGAAYAAGSSRQIDIVVTNTGTDDLQDITLTDATLGGNTVTNLSWTLPNGDVVPADLSGTTWTVDLPIGTVWKPDEVITGTATLTVGLGSAPHTDRVTVEATGVNSGIDVSDDNDYNAFTGGIQVIEYDGELADPVVGTPGAWVIPTKPLVSEDQDANDTDHAVVYPVNTPQTVRWVVTNTGTTSLTNIDLLNPVGAGPDVLATWTADLSDFGGPTNYTFVPGAPWPGILPPGASFFATGTLTLPANAVHADLVTVAANIVVPGTAAVALDSAGTAVVVDDEDPFNAKSGIGPFVDIEKGDGTGSTITNDADTMLDAEDYQPGETRTVVFRVQNTGDEELRNVTLSDETLAGASVQSLVWTFPDSTTASAAPVLGNLTATWANTFSGTSTWAPGAWIYGTAQLTLTAAENPHVDDVTVTAVGVDSATTVTDHDLYNAVTGAVQVIKYDGDTADPVVKDTNGDWIIPSKTAMNAGQDADTPANAVQVVPHAQRTIRWVITNTGTTTLTSIDVADVTLSGPAIDAGWTADLSPIGGPAAYDFVKDGPWEGGFAPGESFFSQGTYRLGAFQTHSDNVNVIATIVVPATDAAGRLAGGPMRDLAGNLVPLTNAVGVVHTVDGGDPFVARARLSLVITGVELQLALMSAFTLLLLGFGLVLLARRRRRAQG